MMRPSSNSGSSVSSIVRAGRQSIPAARHWAHEQSWPLADLRVDWCEEDPIGGLRALWQLYEPQMEDYVTRALDPRSAPSYGVPGDE